MRIASSRPLASSWSFLAAALCSFGGLHQAWADDVQVVSSGDTTVAPAQVVVDPTTGSRAVVVPQGCTAVTQASGQVVVVCPYASPAAAPQRPSPRRPPPPRYEPTLPVEKDHRWYGWQIILTDVGSVVLGSALIAGSADSRNDTGAALGSAIFLGGYALGGPIVHWSHGHVGKGFASLGLRLGAPVAGLLTGLTLASGGSSDDVAVGAVAGFLLGGVAASVIDIAALSREEVPAQRDASRRPQAPKLSWSPTGGYNPRTGAATVGVGGAF